MPNKPVTAVTTIRNLMNSKTVISPLHVILQIIFWLLWDLGPQLFDGVYAPFITVIEFGAG